MTVVFTSACVYIYTVVVPPISIYTDFLLFINYSMLDMPVVPLWILYYTHNVLLLLTRQVLELICDVNSWAILNK